MKHKRDLVLCISCILLAFLLTMAWNRQKDESLAARIAPQILRFHILANSDSKVDQQLKLEVRDLLILAVQADLGEHATLEETKEYILSRRSRLEETAESYMKSKGYDYSAHMELTNCYFPTRTYGDMVFPCGNYDAVRVIIGKGEGHNWWCVLYPPLCFVDSAYAVVPKSSKEILEKSIDSRDYKNLIKDSPRHAKVQLRFKLIDRLFKNPADEH